MFREGGKGFGRGFREVADEHRNEVDAVRKIYSEVLGTSRNSISRKENINRHLTAWILTGDSMPTYVKVPKEVRYGKPTRR